MAATTVSVVVPLRRPGAAATVPTIERYLASTGMPFEVIAPFEPLPGDCVRRGVSESKGEVVVVADPELPYQPEVIGDAVALISGGVSDVVFGSLSSSVRGSLAAWMLHSLVPDRDVQFMAFTSAAAKTLYGESRLADDGCDLEVAFLANKYGFRIEFLRVSGATPSARSFGMMNGLVAAFSIRMANRRGEYRPARRCPVCFSSEVRSAAQIPMNVVRICARCKCRYLNRFDADDDEMQGLPRPRVLHGPPRETTPSYAQHEPSAREKTSSRRLKWLRRQLPAHARVLEVGTRDASFGALAARDYEYVGIDPAPAAARHARSRGLEVYCASLSNFVNTGASFDAITLFHVFENMADPHDALSKVKELLKPGGVLLLSAFDTEGLIFLLFERKRVAQNFRTHLILYSRSALIELLEHSGFEIEEIGPDFEYRDHRFLRHWFAAHHSWLSPLVRLLLKVLPDPTIVSTGSIRIVAKRRSGSRRDRRAIRSVEATHAR